MSSLKNPAPWYGLPAGGAVSTAVPASFASPGPAPGSPAGGSIVGLCTAIRGSRRTSRSFTEPLIIPSVTSPSANVSSEALMRGAPSRRTVAMVLFVPASKRSRTRAANSGASRSISRHAAMTPSSPVRGDDWLFPFWAGRSRRDDLARSATPAFPGSCGLERAAVVAPAEWPGLVVVGADELQDLAGEVGAGGELAPAQQPALDDGKKDLCHGEPGGVHRGCG